LCNNTTKWTSTQKSLKMLPPKMNALSWLGNFSFLRNVMTYLVHRTTWLYIVDHNNRFKTKEFIFSSRNLSRKRKSLPWEYEIH
jgi:hypothetical protein